MVVSSAAPDGVSADSWMSSILGRPAWKIDPKRANLNFALPNELNGPGFFYSRIPTAEVKLLKSFQDAGFRVVDTTITLQADCTSFTHEIPTGVRFAVSEDKATVADIAGSSFELSRLHLDPEIPTEVADRSRIEWASNFFEGQRGDHMVVAENSGKVAAFLQLLGPVAGVLTIDLIAVINAARRLGLGAACISFATQNILGVQKLRVGTQVANTGSLRFYEQLGFSVVASEYVLHLHRT